MKISEVRDGFIKFNADESIYLSSFIRVAGMDKDYIAQISSLKTINNLTVAQAKILFIMRDGELFNYDNTEPADEAEIYPFTLDILRNSVNVTNPVIIGKTLDNSGNIVIDSSALNKKMLVSVDDSDLNNLLLRNLSVQFDNLGVKTVIIDAKNAVKLPKKSAIKDFKLPLNKTTLKYLYNACVNGATQDSKQMIADVFEDMEEYISSVPFVPFGVLKSIVDDMVDNQHVFKLFVLKNKLSYLHKLGYFAENQSEAESLNKILELSNPVVDISSVDKEFLNYYLEYIYSLLNPEKTQVLFESSNNISKRNLKMIIEDSEVPSVFIAHSKYRFLNDIKIMFDNFIIEPTFDNKSVFGVYRSFLSSMPEKTYLIAGEGINYIPIISKALIIDDVLSVQTDEKSEPELSEDFVIAEETEHIDDSNDIDDSSDVGDSIDVKEVTVTEEESVPEESLSEMSEELQDAADNESDEQQEEDILSKEEIIANIEQKSDEVIDSISENVQDIQEIDLFDDDSEDSTEEILENESEEKEVVSDADEQLISEDDKPKNEDVIEPEYEILSPDYEDDIEIAEDTAAPLMHDYEPQNEADLNILETETEDDDSITQEIVIEDGPSDSEEFSTEVAVSDDLLDEIELSEETVGDSEDVLLTDFDDTNNSFQQENTELLTEDYSDEIAVIPSDLEELSLKAGNASEDAGIIKNSDEHNADELITSDNSDISDFDEIVELDPDESNDNDIIIDISDEEENINIDEEIDHQIIEDVDKVYTTIKEPENSDNISDSDLDLIDELNSDSDDVLIEDYSDDILEQPQESIIPEKQPAAANQEILEKRDINTPIVPVYDADIPQEDLVISDSIQQGDSVVHAKYGNGIVEKMIKYGTKTLYSINFENIGRRLLDPTLTEIKKI